MINIFLSYSRRDIEAARFLANELNARGASVFIDYQRLTASENFIQRLGQEINKCDFFVLLVSPRSVDSRWVQAEAAWAFTNQKPIVPVLLEAAQLTDVFFLSNIQHIDFTRFTIDRNVSQPLANLALTLNLPEQRVQDVEVSPLPGDVEPDDSPETPQFTEKELSEMIFSAMEIAEEDPEQALFIYKQVHEANPNYMSGQITAFIEDQERILQPKRIAYLLDQARQAQAKREWNKAEQFAQSVLDINNQAEGASAARKIREAAQQNATCEPMYDLAKVAVEEERYAAAFQLLERIRSQCPKFGDFVLSIPIIEDTLDSVKITNELGAVGYFSGKVESKFISELEVIVYKKTGRNDSATIVVVSATNPSLPPYFTISNQSQDLHFQTNEDEKRLLIRQGQKVRRLDLQTLEERTTSVRFFGNNLDESNLYSSNFDYFITDLPRSEKVDGVRQFAIFDFTQNRISKYRLYPGYTDLWQFSPSSKFVFGNLLSGSKQLHLILICRLQSENNYLIALSSPLANIDTIIISPDDSVMLVVNGAEFAVIETETWEVMHLASFSISPNQVLRFSADGRYLLTGDHTGDIVVYTWDKGYKLRQVITIPRDDTKTTYDMDISLALNEQLIVVSRKLSTGSRGSYIYQTTLIEMDTKKTVFQNQGRFLGISSDGDWLVLQDGKITQLMSTNNKKKKIDIETNFDHYDDQLEAHFLENNSGVVVTSSKGYFIMRPQ